MKIEPDRRCVVSLLNGCAIFTFLIVVSQGLHIVCLVDLMVMPTKINSLSITEDCGVECAAIYMANTTHVDCGAFDAKKFKQKCEISRAGYV